MAARVAIVEVGRRDGLQCIGPILPTGSKLDLVRRLTRRASPA